MAQTRVCRTDEKEVKKGDCTWKVRANKTERVGKPGQKMTPGELCWESAGKSSSSQPVLLGMAREPGGRGGEKTRRGRLHDDL